MFIKKNTYNHLQEEIIEDQSKLESNDEEPASPATKRKRLSETEEAPELPLDWNIAAGPSSTIAANYVNLNEVKNETQVRVVAVVEYYILNFFFLLVLKYFMPEKGSLKCLGFKAFNILWRQETRDHKICYVMVQESWVS